MESRNKYPKTKYLFMGSSNFRLDDNEAIVLTDQFTSPGITFDITENDDMKVGKRAMNARKMIGCLNGIF